MRNNGNGSFSVDGWTVTGLTPPKQAIMLDYDNDNLPDIMEFDPTGPGWLRLRNMGSGNFAYDGWVLTGLTAPAAVL